MVAFDGAATDTHEAVVASVVERHGDVDLAIVAFALLGDGEATSRDVAAAAEIAHVNFTGTITATIAVANRMRTQGHGGIVLLSSVAGERVRSANPVYGGTKAGIDGFAQGFGDELAGDGVHMMIVRPGFVHSAMTVGKKAAPFATTPEKVADSIGRWAEEAGASRISLNLALGDMPHWKVVKNLTLFAEEVIPRLRAKKVAIV